MSSTARGSRLTNSSSPSGSSGSPISSAAARARESKEKRASWASAAAISSAPRTSVGAQLAAHQRLAAVGAAVGEVDDRLEVRRHHAVREELGEPVGARAVEQRVGRDRQALLVVEADGEQAGALGVRDRVQQLLEAVLPAGAGELHALDGDVAVDGLGRQVLDLVEHGRDDATAVARPRCSRLASRSGFTCAASARTATALDLHVEGCTFGGDLDRPAEGRLGLAARPVGAQLVGEVGQQDAAARPPGGRARRPRRASRGRAGRRARGAAAWPR